MMKKHVAWMTGSLLVISGAAFAAGGDADDDVDRRGSSVTSDDRPGNGGMAATGTLGSDRWLTTSQIADKRYGDDMTPSLAGRDVPFRRGDVALPVAPARPVKPGEDAKVDPATGSKPVSAIAPR